MRNYIQPGDTLTLTAPSQLTSGEIVLIGALVGVACGDAENGAAFDLATRGVYELPKVSADVISVGEVVYTDGADVGEMDTAHVHRAGIAVESKGNGATTVKVRLDG